MSLCPCFSVILYLADKIAAENTPWNKIQYPEDFLVIAMLYLLIIGLSNIVSE